MRTTTVSHGDDHPARIALPVLVRLPDLDPPAAAATDTAPLETDRGESRDAALGSHKRRRARRTRHAQPVDNEPAGRWTKLKSQLLFTLIVVAFVWLIGTLIFHRSASQDPHAPDGWNDVAVQEDIPPAVAATDSPAGWPQRLPPVIETAQAQPPAPGVTIPLQGPVNESAVGENTSQPAMPDVAQPDGTIEPAARQAQEAMYPSESIR